MVLKRGSIGPDVAAWQAYLAGQGYAVSTDGNFETQTEAATKAFQRAHNLTADGIVGPDTLRATNAPSSPAPASPRKLSDKGRALIKHLESCSLTAYPDGKDPVTKAQRYSIGYGHNGVAKGATITQAEAERLFDVDAVGREMAVSAAAPRATQQQFDAMVSLSYNIGVGAFKASTVLARHNRGDELGAADAFELWNQSDGKVNPDLVARRERERAVYLHGNYSDPLDGAGGGGGGGAAPPSSSASRGVATLVLLAVGVAGALFFRWR
jgi:lysozyme